MHQGGSLLADPPFACGEQKLTGAAIWWGLINPWGGISRSFCWNSIVLKLGLLYRSLLCALQHSCYATKNTNVHKNQIVKLIDMVTIAGTSSYCLRRTDTDWGSHVRVRADYSMRWHFQIFLLKQQRVEIGSPSQESVVPKTYIFRTKLWMTITILRLSDMGQLICVIILQHQNTKKLHPCWPSTFLQSSRPQRILGFWESEPAMLYFERCILYLRCCMWYFMVYFVIP